MKFDAHLIIKSGDTIVHEGRKSPVGLFYLIRTLIAWKVYYNGRLTYTLTITNWKKP